MEEDHINESLSKGRSADQVFSIVQNTESKGQNVQIKFLKIRQPLKWINLTMNINPFSFYEHVKQKSKMSFKYYPKHRQDIVEWIIDRFNNRYEDYTMTTGDIYEYIIIEFKKIEDAVEFKLMFVND